MSIASPTRPPEGLDCETMPGLGEISRARHIVDTLGGRFSLELGIEVDRDAHEIERWALAATLIGDPAQMSVSVAAYRALERAGIETLTDVRACDPETLASALHEAGYERTASGLHALADAVEKQFPRGLARLGEEFHDPAELERELCALPGWDRPIVSWFLRELRGVWPGADGQLDPRSAVAARHVALPSDLHGLRMLAAAAHLDFRDLEAGLTRVALFHDTARCPGGEECPLAEADREQYVHF